MYNHVSINNDILNLYAIPFFFLLFWFITRNHRTILNISDEKNIFVLFPLLGGRFTVSPFNKCDFYICLLKGWGNSLLFLLSWNVFHKLILTIDFSPSIKKSNYFPFILWCVQLHWSFSRYELTMISEIDSSWTWYIILLYVSEINLLFVVLVEDVCLYVSTFLNVYCHQVFKYQSYDSTVLILGLW